MAERPFDEAAIWHTAGGDNSRGGLYPRSLNHAATPSRRLQAQGALQASVVFNRQGNAFVADMSGAVQALTTDGKSFWRVQLKGGISSTPVVSAEQPLLFVGTHEGWVCALDTFNGAIRWERQVPTKSDPRILSDCLYHPSSDSVVLSSWGGKFWAFDARTGNERFSWDAGISASAAAAGDRSGNLFCLRAVAGKGVEFVRVNGRGEESTLHLEPETSRGARRVLVAAAPVVDEQRGMIYFVANRDKDGLLFAWSLAAGKVAWSQPLAAAVQATPTLLPGGVMVADLVGVVQAFGPDGAALWRYSSNCEYLLAGGVSHAGGSCVCCDPLGMVHVIGPGGAGKILFEARRSNQARPSFDPAGNLYVPSTDRTVYVFPVV